MRAALILCWFGCAALLTAGCSDEKVILSTAPDAQPQPVPPDAAVVPDAAADADAAPPCACPDQACAFRCTVDEQCGDEEYCGGCGDCLVGCREGGCEGGRCDLDRRVCMPTGACCAEDGLSCTVTALGACAGVQLPGTVDCAEAPCRGVCVLDGDCDAADYCYDGQCTSGCRDAPGSCGADRTCAVDTRRCAALPCEHARVCPAYQFCEDSVGLCSDGCRDGAGCAEDERCDQGRCVGFCEAPEAGDCVEFYCDAQARRRPCCATHAACPAGAACTPEGRCELGACPFDAFEPNDTDETATALELRPIGGGRGATIEAIMCTEGVDMYAVELLRGERVLVRLTHDGPENLDLRVTAGGLDEPVESNRINADEELIAPPPGLDALGGRYTLEVHGRVESFTPYTLSIVTDLTGCFPDARDVRVEGDSTAATAFDLDEFGELSGVICPEDEDWFALAMRQDDGLEIELVAAPGSGPLRLELYAMADLGGPDGAPAYVVDEAIAGSDGPTYVFSRPAGEAAFSDDRWLLRVLARGADDVATYALRYRIIRQDGCPADPAEPDDSLAAAHDLDQLPGITEGGRLRVGEDLVVPLAGRSICPLDEDFYCLTTDRGDQLWAWAIGGGVGVATVALLDDSGRPLGELGAVTPPNFEPEKAHTRASPGGRVCVQVDGVGPATRPYTLWLRRDPPLAACAADPEQDNGLRDDGAAQAVPLVDVSGGVGRRFEAPSGYLCDVGPAADEDWRSFPIEAARSRVCVAVDGLAPGARVAVDVFNPQLPVGDVCVETIDCELPAGCIGGRCQPPFDTLNIRPGDEALVNSKAETGDRTGRWLARVRRRPGGVDTAYRLTVTVEPEAACVADWRELGVPNDDDTMATWIGAGPATVCDAWICESERQIGDTYRITLPAGVDRSVIVEFDSNADGRLYLEARAPVDDADPFLGFRTAQDPVGNSQCINLVGGAEEAEIYVTVYANLARSDGEPAGRARVDYVLRVVETDFGADERGACGAQFPACPEDEPFALNCWPWVALP